MMVNHKHRKNKTDHKASNTLRAVYSLAVGLDYVCAVTYEMNQLAFIVQSSFKAAGAKQEPPVM